MPTSSAQAGCAFDDGKADADIMPPACAVGAPGRMPAFRFARRCDNGSVRVVLLEPIRLDATLACASPDRLLKAAGGAPLGKVRMYSCSALPDGRLSSALATARWLPVRAASAKAIGREGVLGSAGTTLRPSCSVTSCAP
ncbi:hypothetical protein D3C71_1261170 [compost metagenome]